MGSTYHGGDKSYVYEIEVPYSIPEHDGTIDIVAVRIPRLNVPIPPLMKNNIFLIIEAKKASSEIKHWVFLKNTHTEYSRLYESSFVSITKFAKKDDLIHIENRLTFQKLGYSFPDKYDKCVNCFEYNEKFKLNRNNDEKIYKPLLQVHRELNGFCQRDLIVHKHRFDTPEGAIFLPIIVTTANLYTVSYNPQEVILPEALLPTDKAILEEKSWLTYDFPLPQHLRSIKGKRIRTEKLTTFIVSANHWEQFLNSVGEIYGFGEKRDHDIWERLE
ncbi:MAG TPA: hypothetical protein VNL73_11480 [Verrucomicrobiae bacterium]|nr:hypothetical protein [Verrucomicrobiae bacterium]